MSKLLEIDKLKAKWAKVGSTPAEAAMVKATQGDVAQCQSQIAAFQAQTTGCYGEAFETLVKMGETSAIELSLEENPSVFNKEAIPAFMDDMNAIEAVLEAAVFYGYRE